MPEPAKDKDKSAKWLIEHHGDAILRLGGVTDLVRWQAAPAELVLPTKLPDGLLFAWRAGRDHPEPFVVEIATYPELRAAEQALRDLLLVYLVRGEVANILVLVLRPKGQLRVPDHAHRPGSDGVTALGGWWRVVELWTLPAEPVLATADPGMMPWVPLMQADEPPEIVLRRCREVIDQHAPAEEHESLITVTQVFTRLRYKDPNLLSILGGKTVMIEWSVAVDPRDCRGKETQGHPQGPSHSLRSRAARAGSRGAIDPRRDGPGRRRGAGGVEPGPGTVRGGGAGDSQAPGALGPGGRARAEGLRNGATTAERPDRFSGTGRVIDRAWNALRLPFRPQFSTSVPAELSMVSPEPHARSSSGRGYKGEMRPAETGRMMGASVQGNE